MIEASCIVCGKKFQTPNNEYGAVYCSVGCQYDCSKTFTANEQLVLNFINGPLKEYLTGEVSFGRFKELVNERCGTNFLYSDLYPSYLFNAKISYE